MKPLFAIRLRDGRKHTFAHMEMMGILNVTPDSFFEGSRVSGVEQAVAQAEQMIQEGATILDIGGESTRPGSAPVSAEEEVARVCPVIKAIRARRPDVLISVDTYRASTARAAVEAGADIINDISAMTFDPQMCATVAACQVPIVLMHTPARPDHMQDNPQYENVVGEVYEFLAERIAAAEAGGIAPDRILIDLGIGFGKTREHNLALLQEIDRFAQLGKPHLLAVSRKTVIGQVTGRQAPADRLFGTVALTAYAAYHGLQAARVHDVAPNLDAARMAEALRPENGLGEMTRSGDAASRQAAEGKTLVAVALGSNQGDRKGYLDQAIQAMEQSCGRVVGQSSVRETPAYGMTNQADFLNMAVLLETALAPQELLTELRRIEEDLGRKRDLRWGPRTIDLDIILYGDAVVQLPDLVIPHPDFRNREFVLQPLAELNPDWIDPETGKTVLQLRDAL